MKMLRGFIIRKPCGGFFAWFHTVQEHTVVELLKSNRGMTAEFASLTQKEYYAVLSEKVKRVPQKSSGIRSQKEKKEKTETKVANLDSVRSIMNSLKDW